MLVVDYNQLLFFERKHPIQRCSNQAEEGAKLNKYTGSVHAIADREYFLLAKSFFSSKAEFLFFILTHLLNCNCQ